MARALAHATRNGENASAIDLPPLSFILFSGFKSELFLDIIILQV